MNPNRMTIEELRTLELPVKLVCDDGVMEFELKEITVKYVGKQKVFVENDAGFETSFHAERLVHYPSVKNTQVYETLHECLADDGRTIWCSNDGRKPLFSDKRFGPADYSDCLGRKLGRHVLLNLNTWKIENG